MEQRSELKTRHFNLYKFMKEWCVGKDKALSNTLIRIIMDDLGIHDYKSRQALEKDFKALRLDPTITRRIAAEPGHGYWLPTSKEDDSDYKKNITKSYVLNGIATGDITKNEIYALLNDTKESTIVDQNQRLKLSEYQNTETKKYSNDL
jgi:hypothetical protein